MDKCKGPQHSNGKQKRSATWSSQRSKRGYGISGKLIAVEPSVYEYNVRRTGVHRNGRTFLSDPAGSDYFMRPMIGLGVEWYTNPWITYKTVDDNHNNGQASDLCRIGHPDDPLMWVATGNDYLKENS